MEEQQVICPFCKGNPWVKREDSKLDHCPTCQGRGYIIKHYSPKEIKKYRNDKSRENATRANRIFTIKELEIVMDSRLTAKQAARKLGRSLKSIETKRHNMRKEMMEAYGQEK